MQGQKLGQCGRSRRRGPTTGCIYSRYKRLADNLIDENYFPVLWRDDGYRTPGIDAYLAR